jgi:hypothetical protein
LIHLPSTKAGAVFAFATEISLSSVSTDAASSAVNNDSLTVAVVSASDSDDAELEQLNAASAIMISSTGKKINAKLDFIKNFLFGETSL